MLRLELREARVPFLALSGPEAPESAGLLFTTRRGGLSTGPFASLNLGGATGDEPDFVAANRKRLAERLDAPAGTLFAARQVHGTALARVRRGDRPEELASREADILVTDAPGARLVMAFADCLPVVLISNDPPVVGIAHAGWRGLVDGVVEKLVTAFEVEWGLGPANLSAALGPAICRSCFAVGVDVARRFRDRFAALRGVDRLVGYGPAGGHVDLAGVARESLAARGVPRRRIAESGLCTACRPDLFFSHRRDKGRTGRHAGVVWIKEAS